MHSTTLVFAMKQVCFTVLPFNAYHDLTVVLCCSGSGVKKDAEKARFWFRSAEANGDKYAKSKSDLV